MIVTEIGKSVSICDAKELLVDLCSPLTVNQVNQFSIPNALYFGQFYPTDPTEHSLPKVCCINKKNNSVPQKMLLQKFTKNCLIVQWAGVVHGCVLRMRNRMFYLLQ